MAVKFFGQYLIEQGIISQSFLLKAVELQESTNRKIGEVVYEMGLMSQADIDKVHLTQRNEDIRFGDKAVAMGLLTGDQLNQALTRQRNSHLYIGEALVLVGGIRHEDLESYLEMFKKDQLPYMVDRIAIPQGVTNPAVWEMVADLTCKMLARVADFSFRQGACQVVTTLPPGGVTAEIDFSGSVAAKYMLNVTANSRKTIARAILQEESVDQEPVAVLNDALMEFVNIVCGNIAAKAAQLGLQLEIAPPAIAPADRAERAVPLRHVGLLFPIHLNGGELLSLALFVRTENA